MSTVSSFWQRTAQQIIGREGETATLLSSCVVSFGLCVIGFAPRQLNRWARRGEIKHRNFAKVKTVFDILKL
jgi:hypothetical protein